MAHKHRETSSQYPQGHVKRKGREKLDQHHPGGGDRIDFDSENQQHSTQILDLQRKLRAAEERILNLQLRNRAAVDDLDDLRASSAADSERAWSEILSLRRRCAVLQDEAERTAREKDEMNDVLRLLVEKVEACNADFTAWSPANLRMSRSLSILPQQQNAASTSSESCSCPRAYAPAIVAELSHLLTCEREAHSETVLTAEQRVGHYEVAIARREADLACVLEACRCEAASVVAASFNEFHDDRSQVMPAREKVERRLAVEVLNLRADVQTEKSRHAAKRRKTTPPPSQPIPSGSSPPSLPSTSTAVPPEPDLITLTRQIDSLHAQVQHLSSEKTALQRLMQTEFPSALPPRSSPSPRSPPSPPRPNRELALLEENTRLREALARAQRYLPSPSRSQSLPSPAMHLSSLLPFTPDPFRSPLPHPNSIDVSFPPLTPDHSLVSAASTSAHGYSPYDNVESLFLPSAEVEAAAEIIPLPLSPLLSPLSPIAGPSRSQSQPRSRVHSPWQTTPLDMSLCSSTSSTNDISELVLEQEEEESPTLRAATLLRAQREAELQMQLEIERRGEEAREREMLELREAIASLAVGAGIGGADIVDSDAVPIPPEFEDAGSSNPG